MIIKDEVLKFFTFEGYFRTFADYRNNFDLNSFYIINPNTENEKVVGASKHLPTISELKNGSDSSSTVSYTTRLRLSPNITVGEYLRAVATIDIFDNELFGDDKTARLYAKEAYFEGKSPIGLFKIGRMATHWGLGINRNDGKGKFSFYGNYIDQFQYEIKDLIMSMPDLSFKLAYEVKQSGIGNNKFTNLNYNLADTYDIEDNDDYVGFTFYVLNQTSYETFEKKMLEDENVFNYGIYAGMYHKDKYTEIFTQNTGNTSNYSYENYFLDYYVFDAFAEFYKGRAFSLKTEFVYSFGDNEKGNSFNNWGGVIESKFNFLMNTLGIGLDLGISSSDDSNDYDPYKTLGKEIKTQRNNFVFNKDYDIDLIFFKQIYDNTGLYFIKPHVSWIATDDISLKLQSVTSMALNEKTTYGRNNYLGTEFDFFIEYLNKDGLNFGIRSGLFLPGNGLDWLGIDGKRGGSGADYKDYDASLAYSTQFFMIMKF